MRRIGWMLAALLGAACAPDYSGTLDGERDAGPDEGAVMVADASSRAPASDAAAQWPEPRADGATPVEPVTDAGTDDASLPSPEDASVDPPVPVPPAADAAAEPGPDATPEPSCDRQSSCKAARALGEMSGDVSSDQNVLTTLGEASRWFAFRLREDAAAPRPLRARISLESEGDAHYDVFVSSLGDGPRAFCDKAELVTSAQGPGPLALELEVPERLFSNGSRTFLIEVRYVAGACAPFTLDVRGP